MCFVSSILLWITTVVEICWLSSANMKIIYLRKWPNFTWQKWFWLWILSIKWIMSIGKSSWLAKPLNFCDQRMFVYICTLPWRSINFNLTKLLVFFKSRLKLLSVAANYALNKSNEGCALLSCIDLSYRKRKAQITPV